MATTSAIDFGTLIGAQLTALIEAEAEGAEKSAEYIENVGFEKQKDGTLRLRMVTFEMARRGDDGKMHMHQIQVPVLTLVPIPLLTIEQADLEFDLHIEEVVQDEVEPVNTKTKPTVRESLIGKSKLSSIQPRARLVTRMARTTKSDTTTAADLSMKVKVVQSPFPIGIERLINIADLSVEDKSDE